MTSHDKYLNDEFHCKNIAWAKKWLDAPESNLPGVLTHNKCRQVLFDSEDALLDLRLSGKYYASGKFAGY